MLISPKKVIFHWFRVTWQEFRLFEKRDDLVRIIWTTLFRWLTPKVISTVTSCIFSHKSGFRISYQRKLKKLIRSLRDSNTPNRRVLPDKDPCDGLIAAISMVYRGKLGCIRRFQVWKRLKTHWKSRKMRLLGRFGLLIIDIWKHVDGYN